MLDQLDEIPWQRLHHAYGTAEDVPKLLRALTRPDRQESALNELFHTIWHQGTIYDASSYAVPFLFELACEQSIARREDILGLVGSLADGTGPAAHVHRARDQVYKYSNATLQFLNDRTPMVRAAAAFVLSRFPDQVSVLGPNIIAAARRETDALAKAALLWCIGTIGDHSSEALSLLSAASRESADPRQAFAAAVAMFRIKGELQPEALSLYRQMAAATWFAQSYLDGVTWLVPLETDLEDRLADIEPDPAAATQSLLRVLKDADANCDVHVSIVHDLLELNFPRGNWRECTQLDASQTKALQSIVDSGFAWKDTQRLWFLIPYGARKKRIASSDIEAVRAEMQSLLKSKRS